ncbi:MAG: L,D-transpeptidase [Acidobacteria bacterium]|nr:L,D-transpeptidase [Acidobacteriota bacterium]
MLLLLVLTLGAQGALPFVSFGKEPAFDQAQARLLARRGQRLLEVSLPEAARAVARATRRAESTLATGSAKGAAWDPVLAAIATGLRELGRLQRGQEAGWLSSQKRLEPALRRARQEAAEPALLRQEAEWLRTAESQAAMAWRLASEQRWQDADEAARIALEATRRIHQRWLAIYDRFSQPTLVRQWQRWRDEAVADSRRRGATRLIVDKLDRTLTVYQKGRSVAAFPVELGIRGVFRKEHAGDHATPEGSYRILTRKAGRDTRYYKALLLDYPNHEDLARFRREHRLGRTPRGKGVGGSIEIHGEGGRGRDWTDGCIALTNPHMDRLFELLTADTQVVIVGSLHGAKEP